MAHQDNMLRRICILHSLISHNHVTSALYNKLYPCSVLMNIREHFHSFNRLLKQTWCGLIGQLVYFKVRHSVSVLYGIYVTKNWIPD